MADNKHTNRNSTDDAKSNRQDSIPGDILTQLDAEHATLGKTFTAVQATKNAVEEGNKLQEITNDFLLEIGQHAEAISLVMSSIDSKVERLVNKFLSANPVSESNLNDTAETSPEYALDATVQSLTVLVSDILTKLSNPSEEPEMEEPTDTEYATEATVLAMASDVSDISQKLDDIAQTMHNQTANQRTTQGTQQPPPFILGPTQQQTAQTEATIRRALERFQNQSQGRDRNLYQETAQEMLSQISERIAQLSDDFRHGTIDQAEFESQMQMLGERAAQIHDTLQDVSDHNEQVISQAASAFNKAQQRTTESLINQFVSGRSADLSGQFNDLTAQFRSGQISESDFTDAAGPLINEMGNLQAGAKLLTGAVDALKNGFDASTGQNHTAKQATSLLGDVGGDIAGAEIGAALGTAIGGPVGTIVGGIVGDIIGDRIGAVFDALGDQLDYLANQGKKSRDEILRAGFDKIEKDVKAMSTYSIEVYEMASQNIYSAWDKNLASINATQGYTKEALNTLQDAVAQRLIKEGYGNTIDASQYLDQLSSTLSAHLGGELAEAFAAQNLILQKAVPEVDLSSMAAQFAAIYTNANAEGMSGEDEMIAAMNEVAGAAKALEQVTGGNNQFLTQTGEILSKATEIVNRADGNASQIADLATQMMAAEAPLTALAPQLSGFTTELVDILTNNNDATAVALRAIMNDIDSSIGVSSTAFMQSFMEDTQGTLSTAFEAIQEFIDKNENEASRQEFLQAMESIFGVSGSKLAQIDFGNVAKQIADANIATNMDALTRAENLVRGGETTSYEEQLVANTANQLLATNAISSTIDNKLMRKLEANELQLEKTVYELQATQSVNLAEESMGFFTKIFDVITSIIDPFGLFDMVNTSIDAWSSAAVDAERYLVVSTMSQIGSDVANAAAGAANTISNTIGGATAAISAAESKNTTAMAAAVAASGTADTFETMMMKQQLTTMQSQAAAAQASAETQAMTLGAVQDQTRKNSEYQNKSQAADEKEAEYEEQKKQAAQAQKEQEEADRARDLENHDNIYEIRDAIASLDLDSLLTPILEENRNQNTNLKTLSSQVTDLIQLVSTMVEYKLATDSQFASTISYDERARIMDSGYVGGLGNGFQARFT